MNDCEDANKKTIYTRQYIYFGYTVVKDGFYQMKNKSSSKIQDS